MMMPRTTVSTSTMTSARTTIC